MKLKDNPDYVEVKDIIKEHMDMLINALREREENAYIASYGSRSRKQTKRTRVSE